ncbi:DUF1996 domain-containing protein [Streptomyces sp. NBC_01498]|uniref:DUF1996 domain-containing protein n=1 Tax=Streptomyces sp. NBC_01498 TaxID=2975870 RepID=UPI002E7BE665|nr:DUF1996 domain-containing protein [Streptomyces sp. NBC_01498]WTL27211.1 DUF1996 domain-containing protein [Streptomyces sp. NBC_01498]
MGRTSRKRSTVANRAIAASAALILGGGGLVAVNVYASAGEGRSGPDRIQNAGRQMSTIDCPEVVNELTRVPRRARAQVDRELARMDTQITVAYKRFADNKAKLERDPKLTEKKILKPLKQQRLVSLKKIRSAIKRAGHPQKNLDSLAPCTMRPDDAVNEGDPGGGQNGGGQGDNGGQGQNAGQDGGQGQNAGQDGGQDGGQGGEQPPPAGNGPEAGDFVDIQSIEPNVQEPQAGEQASTGTFTTECGRNENGLFNSDNVIAAPGVSNGAHHKHDYVGNQANNAFASDDDLANGETTCNEQGDKSTYYWPVIRLQNGQNEADAAEDGGGKDGNVGEIQTPSEVTLQFAGSAASQVTAMPRFLRIITGDAKAFVNGNANANASWSCTGFEDRQLKDKYPICPAGSQVVRSFNFQSCWDGVNTDSANHRTHVAFADQNGQCAEGFKAIPQLRQRIVYDIPPGPGFAVDSFPEQLHKPITDHGDFINVFDDAVMTKMVDCINTGKECN